MGLIAALFQVRSLLFRFVTQNATGALRDELKQPDEKETAPVLVLFNTSSLMFFLTRRKKFELVFGHFLKKYPDPQEMEMRLLFFNSSKASSALKIN